MAWALFALTGARPRMHAGGDADAEATSGMIAKEQHKLEVLKRRQEREIQQMLQYEITRKQLLEKQQKKIEALEVRTAPALLLPSLCAGGGVQT